MNNFHDVQVATLCTSKLTQFLLTTGLVHVLGVLCMLVVTKQNHAVNQMLTFLIKPSYLLVQILLRVTLLNLLVLRH